jgi:hypothetical protein
VPIRVYQFGSRPLRDNVRKTILPGGQPMTDSRRLLSGIRVHSDGRLSSAATVRLSGLCPNLPQLRPSIVCNGSFRSWATSRPISGGRASWR